MPNSSTCVVDTDNGVDSVTVGSSAQDDDACVTTGIELCPSVDCGSV